MIKRSPRGYEAIQKIIATSRRKSVNRTEETSSESLRKTFRFGIIVSIIITQIEIFRIGDLPIPALM
jgi:hypothetical protein